jgi:two-component system nitrogen regulation response regulator GlnG
MQEVFRAIGRLSQSHATVLINGESGTGKELVARALHRHSPRKDKPFIAINTAAIPRDLLESELFGHERGAFTGATAQRRGRFEQADGGTLFLDEIGDMPAELQTRLLRVLSDGSSTASAATSRSRPTCASSPPPTRTSKTGSRRGCSAKTCSTASTSSACACRRCASGARTSRCWRKHFLQKSAQELGVEPKRLSEAAIKYLQGWTSPATCGNWKTSATG